MIVSDNDLDDLIIDRIVQAHAAKEPIEAGKGPYYDSQLKKQLGLRVHQSRICKSMKRLLDAGMVQTEDTGDVKQVFGSDRTWTYPVLRFLPA